MLASALGDKIPNSDTCLHRKSGSSRGLYTSTGDGRGRVLAQSVPNTAAAQWTGKPKQHPQMLESSSAMLGLGNDVDISLKNSSSFSILCTTEQKYVTQHIFGYLVVTVITGVVISTLQQASPSGELQYRS